MTTTRSVVCDVIVSCCDLEDRAWITAIVVIIDQEEVRRMSPFDCRYQESSSVKDQEYSIHIELEELMSSLTFTVICHCT